MMNQENEFNTETPLTDEGIEIAPGVEYGGTDKSAQEKITSRMKLLSMPPEAAQRSANMTLYPQYWRVEDEDLKWSESINSHYGDDEYESNP